MRLAVETPGQGPIAVLLDRAQKIVAQAHGIVRVLAGDGQIGFRIPIGRERFEIDLGLALAGQLDDFLDGGVGDESAPGELDFFFQRRILFRVEAVIARPLAIDAGAQNRLQGLLQNFRAGHEGRDLAFLLHLPVDKILDVGMIGIDNDHFRGAPCCAAGFDRTRGAVADF